MTEPENPSLLSVPAFWPMAMRQRCSGRHGALREEPQIRRGRDQNSWRTATIPCDAEPGTPRSADHDVARLRKAGGIPTLIDAPHAGHTAVIADYYEGQSLVQTLLANGIDHVALTDWKSATPDMRIWRSTTISPKSL